MTVPYWRSDTVKIYNTDALEFLAGLAGRESAISLLLTDPPYGISLATNYKSRKRGALAECNDYPPIINDNKPFDPTPLLAFTRVVIFGANYFANRLPHSPSWIVWDKLDGLTSKRPFGFNDQADLEMAWSNLGGPARLIRHRWMGAMKGSERGNRRVHPTQKPIALMERIISAYTQPGDLILDPYMGAGSTLIAAVNLGRRAIGVELSPDYCEIAKGRILAAQRTALSGKGDSIAEAL